MKTEVSQEIKKKKRDSKRGPERERMVGLNPSSAKMQE